MRTPVSCSPHDINDLLSSVHFEQQLQHSQVVSPHFERATMIKSKIEVHHNIDNKLISKKLNLVSRPLRKLNIIFKDTTEGSLISKLGE